MSPRSQHVPQNSKKSPARPAESPVDGDGKLDLIARAATSLQSQWLLSLVNAGDATFTEREEIPIPVDSFHMTAADMNGDGLSDVVIPQLFAGTVTVFMNEGDGTFVEYSISEIKKEARGGAAVADLDGDGKLDIAVPYSAGGTGGPSGVSVLRGLRIGEFAPAKYYSVGDGPSSIQAVDMDGDGSLDLVLPCTFGFNVSVLLNRGDGTFFKNRAFPFGIAARSLFAATPDLDGDSLPDLAVADDNGGVLTLSLNTTRPPQSHDENRNGIPDPCELTPFHRGDADASGAVELTDPIFILDHLFTAGPAPPCREAADADNDGALVVTDAIQLLLYLFLGGTPPADPGPPPAACGQDSDAPGAAGDLGCDAYGRC